MVAVSTVSNLLPSGAVLHLGDSFSKAHPSSIRKSDIAVANQLIIDTSSPPGLTQILQDPNVLRVIDQSGFVACVLALSLLVWALTRFVEAVKKDN